MIPDWSMIELAVIASGAQQAHGQAPARQAGGHGAVAERALSLSTLTGALFVHRRGLALAGRAGLEHASF